jgi:hypothetical protein
MARTKTQAPEDAPVLIDAEAVQAAGNALVVQSETLANHLKVFGVTSLDRQVLVTEIQGWLVTTSESLFNIGARLVVLRELCDHGAWGATMDELGMSRSTAARLMQATLKLAYNKERYEAFAPMARSKVLELVTLDDQHVQALAEGQSVGSLTLDKIDASSLSELRREVRKLKADLAGKDKLLEKRGKRIYTLELERDKRYEPDASVGAETAEQAAQMQALQQAHLEALHAQAGFIRLVVDVRDNNGSEAMVKAASDALESLAQLLAEAINLHGFAVQFEAQVSAPWMQATAGKGKAAR